MKNASIVLGIVVLVAGVAFYRSTRARSQAAAPHSGKGMVAEAGRASAKPAKLTVAAKAPQPHPQATTNESAVPPGTLCPEPPPAAKAAAADRAAADVPVANQSAPLAEEAPPVAAAAPLETPSAAQPQRRPAAEPEPVAHAAPGPAPALASAPCAPDTATLPRVVDLGADKCKACKELAPILAELKKEYAGRVNVEFIDVWKNRAAGQPYKIRVIPTQIFFDRDGNEVWRHEGFLPKADFITKFAELGVK